MQEEQKIYLYYTKESILIIKWNYLNCSQIIFSQLQISKDVLYKY